MQHDAVVIGGSFAGLSAALYIARGRRSVCVIDAGAPRNRFAAASHGFFSQDGSDPRAMIGTARAQLADYPNASFVMGEAVDAYALDDGPLGPIIRTDASKLTTVPGIYAAGDAARASHSAIWAAADGATAGVSLHQALVFNARDT